MAERLEDVDAYIDEWTKMMVVIWRERITRLRVVRTGALHQSFQHHVARSGKAGYSMTFKFLQYGIYQTSGVGNGYKRGNGGDLDILNREYRESHGLNKRCPAGPTGLRYMSSGKPRSRRDWKWRPQVASRFALIEDLSRIIGEEIVTSVVENLKDS